MEKIKALTTFVFADVMTGTHLTMQAGRVCNLNGTCITGNAAQRWRFFGRRIPMPVRSGTWFQGLNPTEMIDWLGSYGYVLKARVDIESGIGHTYNQDGAPKGNGFTDSQIKRFVKSIYEASGLVQSIVFYKTAKGCLLTEARDAVNAILDEQD